MRVHFHPSFRCTSPSFAASFIYLYSIFSSLFLSFLTRSIACDAFPFPLLFLTRTAPALHRCLAVRAPLVRSRPRLRALRQGQPLALSLARMHACSLIYLCTDLCTSTLSHCTLSSVPVPVCARFAKPHTLDPRCRCLRLSSAAESYRGLSCSGFGSTSRHSASFTLGRQHGRHAAATAAPPCVAAVVAAPFRLRSVRCNCS